MRIVQLITRPQRRGAEIFAIQLAEELITLGHEVRVISVLKGKGGLDFSVKIIQLDLDGIRKFDLIGFKKLANELSIIQPDLVQANASDTLRYAVGAKYFCSTKFKLVYRNANTISSFIRAKTQLYFNQFLQSNVDAVISVSENSMLDYQKLFKAKLIKPIPIGINTNEIDMKLEESVFQIDKNYLLFVGSLVPEKDPLDLLKIFKEVLNKNLEIKLVYLGSGQLINNLEKEIAVLGLTKSVQIIPSKENIFPILSKARALLMPSKIEGLPGVILEAMYCKIPVIAYGVGGIPEILGHKKTGWCIEPGNSKDFENSILEVLNSDSSAIQEITSVAKELVLKNYQIDQIAKKFESFYVQISNSKTD